MENLASRISHWFRNWSIPRDGARRYLYDIWQPLMLFVLTASFTGAFFTTYDPYSGTYVEDLFFCNADGNLEKTNYDYKPFWDPGLFFTVNLAFGRFSFSTVKVIDAGWDTIVGRGGQALAAIITYPTLRRSLTLTMEKSAIAIPTVASIYCQQGQMVSVGHILHDMYQHWVSHKLGWRQKVYSGRWRLAIQVFALGYVLFFATLVSVMTGYRTQLTGYFGYEPGQSSQMQSISQLERPALAMYDGSRIGLSDQHIYAPNEYTSSGLKASRYASSGFEYDISALIDGSSNLEQPWGAFIDYYFACLGVSDWIWSQEFKDSKSYSLNCTSHECSCSADYYEGDYLSNDIAAHVKSNITINGTLWELPAPPLAVSLAIIYVYSTPPENGTQYLNANDYWVNGTGSFSNTTVRFANYSMELAGLIYMSDNKTINETEIKRTSRCVAEDEYSYSWGFSSLILLTFCSYTMLFALLLLLLETDVYWNSRHDRYPQSHSIYADMLYLAEEMKAIFGRNVTDHIQSPMSFDKQVKRHKQCLRLEVDDLPLSRWQEWSLSRARRVPTRGAWWTRKAQDTVAGPAFELDTRSGIQPAGSSDHLSAADISRSAGGSTYEEEGFITSAARASAGTSTIEVEGEEPASQRERSL